MMWSRRHGDNLRLRKAVCPDCRCVELRAERKARKAEREERKAERTMEVQITYNGAEILARGTPFAVAAVIRKLQAEE